MSERRGGARVPDAARDGAAPFGSRRHLVALVLLAVSLGTGACFSGRLPARELYRLNVPPAPDVTAPAGPLIGTIEVERYETPGLYGDGNIVFRTGENEYAVYPSREWGIPLGEMLALLTENALERAPLSNGGAVYDAPAGSDLPYVWRGMVREFDEIDRGRDVFVAVRLDAQLVRTADDIIIWKGSRRLEAAVPKPTMAAIVAGLSVLATDATQALINDARSAVSTSVLTPAASTQSPR